VGITLVISSFLAQDNEVETSAPLTYQTAACARCRLIYCYHHQSMVEHFYSKQLQREVLVFFMQRKPSRHIRGDVINDCSVFTWPYESPGYWYSR